MNERFCDIMFCTMCFSFRFSFNVLCDGWWKYITSFILPSYSFITISKCHYLLQQKDWCQHNKWFILMWFYWVSSTTHLAHVDVPNYILDLTLPPFRENLNLLKSINVPELKSKWIFLVTTCYTEKTHSIWMFSLVSKNQFAIKRIISPLKVSIGF